MNPPREPSADLRTAAGGMHEWFTALIGAGFTENQALHIIGLAIQAAAPRREE